MSDPIRTLLERVKELDEKATEGTWSNDPENCAILGPVLRRNGLVVQGWIADFVDVEADAMLIAEYRTITPALALALEAVLEVHQPFIWDFGYGPLESCKGCADQGAGDHDYPCPTVRTITERLGGET